MAGGTNGPPIFDGAPFTHPTKTLLQLRNDLMKRLGYAALLSNPPPGMVDLLDSFLQSAQEQIYPRYSPKRLKRWWPITVTQGNRLYDIPAISSGSLTDVAFVSSSPDTITRVAGSWIDDGFKAGQQITVNGSSNNDGLIVLVATVSALTLTLDPDYTVTAEAAGTATVISTMGDVAAEIRSIDQVWIQDGTRWFKLQNGISPGRFNETGQAMPDSYEIREYLELWPDPDKTYTLWWLGRMGLRPFTADTHETTVDAHLIFLLALANAKAHYRQPDAQIIFGQYEVQLRRLNSDNFGERRYVPTQNQDARSIPEPSATWR